jgi:hypothetical protein
MVRSSSGDLAGLDALAFAWALMVDAGGAGTLAVLDKVREEGTARG